MGAPIDLAGQRFGRLTASERTDERDHGSVVWRCRCDCGRTALVSARNLRNGHTTSCGCARGKEVNPGDRFGSLRAVERVGTDGAGQALWRCSCDCGGEVVATAAKLNFGDITSCGCHSTRKERVEASNGVVDGTRLSGLTSKTPRNNTSGVKGVFFNNSRGRWTAQIKLKGKNRYLGSYATLQEAAEARRAAEQELFDPILAEHGRKETSEERYQSELRDALGK